MKSPEPNVAGLGPAPAATGVSCSEAACELVTRARAGDPAAFAALVDLHGARVFNYLLRMTRSRHDAEDLTQETFVKVHRMLPRFRSAGAFPTWLFIIARRTALNHFRRARPLSELDAELAAPAADPAATAADLDDRRSLWTLVDTLRPEQREILWLRYGEDLSVAEVGRVTGRTSLHVRVLLHRARRELLRRHEAAAAAAPAPLPANARLMPHSLP